jgi:DAK2 domain fusion protein YloV
VAAYCRALLLGARGNSGVIMSQLIGAALRRLAGAPPGERLAEALAAGMVAATEAGYAAVGRPVEGTMLSVARSASEEAVRRVAADPGLRTRELLEAVRRVAEDALARTPQQLAVLRDAGVVDAGGRGLCLVFDAAAAAFTGRRQLPGRQEQRGRRVLPVPCADPGTRGELAPGGPAYEVMYLLDADDAAVPRLRAALQPLGDSLVVSGGEGLWNVHVHVDDVGAALEAGLDVGRPYRVRVTHFADQIARSGAREQSPRAGRGVLALSAGEGLSRLFAEAGAAVVESGVGRKPSTEELLEAIKGTGAAEVIVIPNARDVLPAAEAAVRLAAADHGIRAAVIPTSAQVQGLAALAVHEPGRPFDQDLVEMTAAARHARSGAVTVAARQAITMAGPCEPGDALGIVEGDFAVVGEDLFTVAVRVIDRMLGGGGELFTVVAGEGAEELARRCAQHLESTHPTVDVLVYDGGQTRYPLLFGVE